MKKLAVVLGGSKGLGAEIIEALASSDFHVCNISRSSSPKAQFNLQCDFSSERSVQEAIRVLETVFEKREIHQFYWVAGCLYRARFKEADPSALLKMIDTNLRNPLLLAQWIYKKMSDHGSNSNFCVISSTAGISEKPREDEGVYAATKAAQVSFTRALGKNSPSSKVTLICPGGMKTELWRSTPNTEFESFLDPKKVAEVVVDLVQHQQEPYLEKVIPRGSL